MQRTVRTLRVLLPVAFILFIGLLGITYRSNVRRTGSTLIDAMSRGNDRAQIVTYEFDDTQTLGGRVVSRVRARRTTGFESGWYKLEGVEITVFRPNGSTYQVVAPEAQFHSQTKQAQAKGGVRVVSSDGIEVSTAALDFDGNRLLNNIPVAFRINRWRGNAGGIDLNIAHESVRLTGGVKMVLVPVEPSEPPLHANATGVVFLRAKGEVTFYEGVDADRAGDRFRVDSMTAQFEQTHKTLTGLNGQGNVVVRLGGALAGAQQGERTITADRLTGEIDPAGQITAINLLGDAKPVHGIFEGQPRRELDSRILRVAFNGSALTEIRADENVKLVEPDGRSITAGTMTVFFDQANRNAKTAMIQRQVQFTTEKVSGRAELANYDIANERVVLTGDPKALPVVTSEGQTIRARLIEISIRDSAMTARGGVVAQSRGRQGDAIFPGGSGDTFVNADLLVARQANNTTHFTGNVKAWQESNTLLANELKITGNGEVVNAAGNVRMMLYNARGTARATPTSARSARLEAKKNDRRIDLDGDVQIIEEGRKIDAAHATLTFDAARKMERVEAGPNVTLTEDAMGRKAKADRAVYRPQQRDLVLTGNPAVLEEKRGTVRGTRIVFDLTTNRVDVAGGGSDAYNP